MAGNTNFDALLSTTLQNYRPTLVDNIFTARVLLEHLNSAGRVVVETGGSQIIEPLVYAQNDTVGSYSGYDAIDLTPQEGISAAEYDWKQMAASIAISGIEEAKNRGSEAIIKLLNAKIMQAEESIKESLNTMLFASSTPGNGGKDFNGLGWIIDASNTVGNIDPSTNTWWRSYEENSASALTQAYMATAFNTASKGSDVPDMIVTTQTLFEKYESLLTNQVRYQDTNKANLGFQNLMFKQTPVVFDVSCPSGNMFFLNSKYLKLTGMADHWFTTSDFQKGTVAGVDARYALILAIGQLTCSNRARQAKLTAKTA
jgi:hypothetical protein